MENQVQENNVVEEVVEGGATTEEVKTYTQEEVNELLKGYKSQEEINNIVNKRLARERKDIEARVQAERDEAEKLAKMNAEEKAKHEFEKRVKEFEAKEKELARKELLLEANKQLEEVGISIKASKWVLGKDAEETYSNIQEFNEFIKEIEDNVRKNLLKGKTPTVGLSQGPVISKETFDKMSYLQRAALKEKNPALYNELLK